MATHPPFTLVLTAAPGSGRVTDAVVRSVLDVPVVAGAAARWLSAGDAWEARIDAGATEVRSGLRDAVARAVGEARVDVNIMRGDATALRKRLLCADMESTIIQQELIDEIAGLAGCRTEIAAVTEAAMRGELDFEASLVRRVALFAGLDVRRLDGLLDRVTPMPGAETLIRTMRANGARCALISGGFTIFAERIADRFGFDAMAANTLEIEDRRLTGRVREPILGPRGKAEALRRLAFEGGVAFDDTIAVGDGANDVAMLAVAGLGVAFRAKPILADQARSSANGAVIAHGDLTALLYLQGYARDSFTN